MASGWHKLKALRPSLSLSFTLILMDGCSVRTFTTSICLLSHAMWSPDFSLSSNFFLSNFLFHAYYSDAIRIVLLNRFGGWYSDMNFVFLRPFETVMGKYEMRNFMAAADVDFHDYDNLIYNWGNVLADRLFHVEAGHIFLEAAMIIFNDTEQTKIR